MAEAGISDLVQRLPEGARTLVTAEFAKGSDLSGGQWQRVALARALHSKHTGARLMILDEPTAHLDVRAEHEFNERFLQLTAGTTAVLVSQRLSTVRSAERILFLSDGQVIETGSHHQLIGRGGHYARLFEAQAQAFQSAAANGAGGEGR
jgi:ABC-type multidrug transport system fused ATPase/permease subunit